MIPLRRNNIDVMTYKCVAVRLMVGIYVKGKTSVTFILNDYVRLLKKLKKPVGFDENS